MAEKRKDSKGRILRKGEIERNDGRYEYRYLIGKKKRISVYARTLPELREKEKKIQYDLFDGIDTSSSNILFNNLFKVWFRQKTHLKDSTKSNYYVNYKNHIMNTIGDMPISKIRYSHILELYNNMVQEKHLSASTIHDVNIIVSAVLDLAVKNNLIRINPVQDAVIEACKNIKLPKKEKKALTVKEQENFLKFLSETDEYRKWLPLFTVLLGTGCRIGEALGLTWNDCDFKKNLIFINHSLTQYETIDGHSEFHITTPKTPKSVRYIPMLKDVKKALLSVKKEQLSNEYRSPEVDGYNDFVFVSQHFRPLGRSTINHVIKRIIRDYNNMELLSSHAEKRMPECLPHFSCHTFRHTFATRMYENNMNPKTIQAILGHSNLSTTMDIYTDETIEHIQDELQKIEGKIRIS